MSGKVIAVHCNPCRCCGVCIHRPSSVALCRECFAGAVIRHGVTTCGVHGRPLELYQPELELVHR